MFKKMMKRLTNNPVLKILSIVIAIILWLVVVNYNNPKISRLFTVPIQFTNEETVAGMGKVYQVAGKNTSTENSFVNITVRGERSILEKLSPGDFSATVDLSQIDYQSENEEKPVPINVTPPKRYEKDLEITQRTKNLMVVLEDLAEERAYVVGTTSGTPAEGHAIGEVTVSPSLLSISGPQSLVSKVKRIGANVDVEGLTDDFTANVSPVLYDEEGNAIESSQIKLSEDEVTVSVQILGTKTVPVVCDTMGEPADGYLFTGVEYAPETVEIKGKASDLNHVSGITIAGEAMNLEGATENVENSIDITPYLPEGISLVNPEENKIAVRALVEKLEVKNLELPVKELEILNLDEERYKAIFHMSVVSVAVRGRGTELESLTAEQLRGSIDLNDLEPGSHQVTVDVRLDPRFQIVGSPMLQVTVQELEAEGEEGTGPGTGGAGTGDSESGTEGGTGGSTGTEGGTGTGSGGGTGTGTGTGSGGDTGTGSGSGGSTDTGGGNTGTGNRT